jgi:hypothetical protein
MQNDNTIIKLYHYFPLVQKSDSVIFIVTVILILIVVTKYFNLPHFQNISHVYITISL